MQNPNLETLLENPGSCIVCFYFQCSCVLLPCLHVNCCDICLEDWTEKENTCPTCRKEIKGTVDLSDILSVVKNKNIIYNVIPKLYFIADDASDIPVQTTPIIHREIKKFPTIVNYTVAKTPKPTFKRKYAWV